MALTYNALTSLDNAKLYLRVTNDKDDDLLEALIIRATNMIENQYCNRPLINVSTSSTTSLASQTEYFDGGRYDLHLKYYPISTITSVYDDPDRTYTDTGDVVNSTDYVIYENEGRLNFDSKLSDGTHSVRVIYTGGYTTTTLPAEIEQACIEITGILYKQTDNLGISGKSFSDGSVSYYQDRISWIARDALGAYRNWNV